MRSLCAALLLLALLCVPASLAEAADPQPAELHVEGVAEVTLAPDYAVVSLSVRTAERSVAAALRKNADTLADIRAALEDQGIDAADMTTLRFSIDTNYDAGSFGSSYRISGFTVAHGLSVTVRDMAAVGGVIDAAFAAGATQCGGVEVRAEAAQDARDRAMVEAIAEGRRRAELMAEACGGRLGRLVSATDMSPAYSSRSYSADAVSNAAFGTQIVADGVTFTGRVSLVFELAE